VRVVLLGPPGAGKGTQAALLAGAAGVAHVATGDIFRRAVAEDSPLGRQVRGILERGDLVPDELTVSLIRGRLEQPDCAAGFVLDGFPRTLAQAAALDGLLAASGTALDAAIALEVTDEVVLRRLSGRRVCPACGATYHVDTDPPGPGGVCRACGAVVRQRDDDREETVQRRLQVYHRDTAPILGYYAERGLLLRVVGEGTVPEVAARVRAAAQGRHGQ
jgi:adenylate kinase